MGQVPVGPTVREAAARRQDKCRCNPGQQEPPRAAERRPDTKLLDTLSKPKVKRHMEKQEQSNFFTPWAGQNKTAVTHEADHDGADEDMDGTQTSHSHKW
ncbi:Hypothetical predicted protein [Pelobates cultripes]|uniref:Uncharacterized protein n=1 Tax=Pelobates cultripes TaxID=61616 RepID=A0AAD1T0D0_PELCU|nr:Hypothetical predicted protein [Pelobates cultripes]